MSQNCRYVRKALGKDEQAVSLFASLMGGDAPFSLYRWDEAEDADRGPLIRDGAGRYETEFTGATMWSARAGLIDIPYGMTGTVRLDHAAEICAVTVEIWTWEPVCGFAEHYMIDDDGMVMLSESRTYAELDGMELRKLLGDGYDDDAVLASFIRDKVEAMDGYAREQRIAGIIKTLRTTGFVRIGGFSPYTDHVICD